MIQIEEIINKPKQMSYTNQLIQTDGKRVKGRTFAFMTVRLLLSFDWRRKRCTTKGAAVVFLEPIQATGAMITMIAW